MYAIIRTGGKQYRVAVGDEIFVEKLNAEVGDEVVFDDVLAIADESGAKFGNELKGTSVKAEVIRQGKGKKLVIFKMKSKKGYRRKKGHRQPYTRVAIRSIA